jgi:hypothetical protein
VGKYLVQLDLETALSRPTVAAIFTDPDGDGSLDQFAIEDVINRAEGEVDSFLIPVIDITSPNLNRFDRLLKLAAVEFAVCFSFERHPEYVKTFGEDPRSTSRYQRAVKRMERIQSAVQELPDQNGAVRPANVGAIIYDSGPRMICDSPDGTQNSDGF